MLHLSSSATVARAGVMLAGACVLAAAGCARTDERASAQERSVEFYRPVDTPLGWAEDGGRLIYLHEEQDAQGDAYHITCGASGIYETDGQSPPRPIVTGRAWCGKGEDAALTLDGRTILRGGSSEAECGKLHALDLRRRTWRTLVHTCAAYLGDPVPAPAGDVVAVRLTCAVVVGGGEPEHRMPSGCTDWPEPEWRLMRMDGTDARPFGLTGDRSPAWSPDGRRIAVERKDGGIDVVERESARRVPFADGEAPAWSRDGRWIAFVRIDSTSAALHVKGADGSGERVVFINRSQGTYSNGWGNTREGLPLHPLWSPDGRRIVFTRNYRTGFTLWSVDVDGGNLRQVAPILPPG